MLGDLGMLVLRAVTGSLPMGHGSQKLFGWFGGGGIAGTAGFLETMRMRPGRLWAVVAGAAGELPPGGGHAPAGCSSAGRTARNNCGEPEVASFFALGRRGRRDRWGCDGIP